MEYGHISLCSSLLILPTELPDRSMYVLFITVLSFLITSDMMIILMLNREVVFFVFFFIIICTKAGILFCPLLRSQGPVVQSLVSLTSLLRVISLTVLADSIHNIQIFFAEKT